MTANDPDELPEEDRTVPSAPQAGGDEERTIPSQPVGELGGEERTVPSGSKLPTDGKAAGAAGGGRQDVGKSGAGKPGAGKPGAGKSGAGKSGDGKSAGNQASGKGAAGAAEDKTVQIQADDAARRRPGGDLLGLTIGGCRIDGLLGRGAMGAVYKARQLKLDRDVAVKVIRPEMMTDPRMLKRFEVEARTVGKFNSANVVMVHDVGFEHGVHYLVMEFVKGKNLREHAKMLAGGRLPAGEALPLIEQACKGLDEARRLGVVHRDIKPDNLMLTDQGVLKIADFGIAKPVQDDFSMTLTSELIGTPLYMSPEQCQGGADIDFRSDMYSLGATFFYLLTGEPPVRASSVYELIQTKTKLENLCLWKALPELDENNPLSRVIERMTANDRDDRYESYEELLNDLVLVKHGETITVRPKKAKKKPVGGGARRDDGKKGSGMIAVALTLLVLGGGGGAFWYFNQQKAEPVTPPSPQPGPKVVDGGGAVVDAKAAKAALDRFRGRLRKNGPGGTLRNEIRAEVVPAEMQAEQARLVADVEAGEKIEQAIAAIAEPTDLQLPFDDLKAYYQAIDAAATLESAAGSEVREWMQGRVAAARDEDSFGAAGRAALLEAFTAWDADRARAGADKARLAALGARLDTIDKGRLALVDLLPGTRAALAALRDRVEAGRRKLAEPEAAPVVVDISDVLSEVRAEFEQLGPKPSQVRRLEEQRNMSVAQLGDRDALQNEITAAIECLNRAEDVDVPSTLRPPFDDVRDFWKLLDDKLAPLEVVVEGEAEPRLPAWAASRLVELRREADLEAKAVASCRALWRDWQRQADDGATFDQLTRKKGAIERAVAAAQELFPNADLAQAVPATEMEARLADVRQGFERDRWLEDVAKTRGRIDAVRTFADWALVQATIDGELAALRATFATLPAEPALANELKLVEDRCQRWSDARTQLDRAATQLSAADLTGCKNTISAAAASEGRQQFDNLRDVVQLCIDAFDVLEKELDLAVAQQKLGQAREAVVNGRLANAVLVRVEAWQRSLQALADRTADMVAIPAGRLNRPNADVPAFFIAKTECTEASYERFVAELRALAQGEDDAARFAAVEARLDGCGMTASRLARLIRKSPGSSQKPVGRVSWFEAAAFAKFYGLSLPTHAEWALAAFGPGNKHKFPWGGDSWTDSDDQRNSRRSPVDVTDGGLSWRSASLHHLAGNVAEWLDGDPASSRGELAGGRASQPRFQQERAAEGELEDASRTVDNIKDYGFRVVLRPRDFGALEWPH